jgi:DNA-binding NtrC family response regulator
VHHRINKKLRDFFQTTAGHSSFYFYEYLLEKPVTCWDDFAIDEVRNQSITAPFLRLFAYQTGFMPAVAKDDVDSFVAGPKKKRTIESVPLTNRNIRKFWGDIDRATLDLTQGDVLSCLMNYWRSGKARNPFSTNLGSRERVGGIASLIGAESTAVVRGWPDRYAQMYKKDPNSSSLVALLLREYDLVLRPWLRAGNLKHIGFASYSISTQAVFWGECLVVFPLENPADLRRKAKLTLGLSDILRSEIRTVYAPMLCLLENSVYEHDLAEAVSKADVTDPKPTHLPPTLGISPNLLDDFKLYFRWLANDLNGRKPVVASVKKPKFIQQLFARLALQLYASTASRRSKINHLEWALIELWADRFAYFQNDGWEDLQESLVFAKYLVASPNMVRCTEKAMSLRHKKASKRRAVRSALVVGGPGSGKDAMAQLVRLFSPGFRLSGAATLNMATFRPKEAAVPLLLGLETTYNGKGHVIAGLFEKILKGRKVGGRGFTFILDELNSLDIDTQGALLRVLENAELQPLGAVSKSVDEMDLLIVGVMNEDPQMIMKRQAMDRVLQQHDMFGAILGQSLHEMLRRQRRLRDDLYYRFIRGGEIILPDLKDRREDIPILFFFYVDKEYKTLMPETVKTGNNWQVELPVYDALTDAVLPWEGNLRELQTITRNIVIEAVADFESQGDPNQMLLIKGIHARHALSNQGSGRRRESALVPP